MKEQFPFKAWKLTPGFQPKEIVITKSFGWTDSHYHTDTGVSISKYDIFQSKEQAIAEGHERLATQRKKLEKMQAMIEKREAALVKASKQ